jgi:hypothetical protein
MTSVTFPRPVAAPGPLEDSVTVGLLRGHDT